MPKPAEPERVRVVLLLDRDALADLDLMISHRLGPRSRSELVREAIGWWRAKNAAWIIRARSIDERRARLAAEEERAIRVTRAERDREAAQVTLEQARRIAKDNPTGGVV